MKNFNRKGVFKRIQTKIDEFGADIYLIPQTKIPRFAYTIGLSEWFGAELIFCGGIFYMGDEVNTILSWSVGNLKENPSIKPQELIKQGLLINSLGRFTFKKAHPTWSKKLILGAMDFYGKKNIPALQIVPDKEHFTLDTPDLSIPFDVEEEPAWKWLVEGWDLPVPPSSIAAMDIEGLKGGFITEVGRWEEDYWEVFSGVGPPKNKRKGRFLPIGTPIAIDPTLKEILNWKIGEAHWRTRETKTWQNFKK